MSAAGQFLDTQKRRKFQPINAEKKRVAKERRFEGAWTRGRGTREDRRSHVGFPLSGCIVEWGRHSALVHQETRIHVLHPSPNPSPHSIASSDPRQSAQHIHWASGHRSGAFPVPRSPLSCESSVPSYPLREWLLLCGPGKTPRGHGRLAFHPCREHSHSWCVLATPQLLHPGIPFT